RNELGPWYPHVRARRRIRFVVQPDGEDPRVIWTGYISRTPRSWRYGDGTVNLSNEDLLAIVGEVPLQPSPLRALIMKAEPVAYWPLGETSGTAVEDLATSNDGAYTREVTPVPAIVPWSDYHEAN